MSWKTFALSLVLGAVAVSAGYVPQVGYSRHHGANGGYGGAAAIYAGVQNAYSGYGGGGGIGYGHGGTHYIGPSYFVAPSGHYAGGYYGGSLSYGYGIGHGGGSGGGAGGYGGGHGGGGGGGGYGH